jgi:hypothetical protein
MDAETLAQWDEEDRKADEDIKLFDIRIQKMRVIVELKKYLKERNRWKNASESEKVWLEYLKLKREGYADMF